MKPLLSGQPVTQKGDRPSNELVQIIQDAARDISALRSDVDGAFPNGQLVARVNFNGTGTVAIRSSSNVASITDNGTGDYTVNFATALVDANYVAVITGTDEASAAPVAIALPYIISQTAFALRFRFSNPQDGAARADKAIVNVAVFR